MPYRVYFEGEILRADFTEIVIDREIIEFATVLEKMERSRPVVPHRISDLSKTSGLNIGFRELLALADRRKSVRFVNAFKSAIIAQQPVHVGLARMFQTLNEHPQITIKIFPDLPAALAWIAEA